MISPHPQNMQRAPVNAGADNGSLLSKAGLRKSQDTAEIARFQPPALVTSTDLTKSTDVASLFGFLSLNYDSVIKGRIALQGPELQLKPAAVHYLAIALHDLLSISLRHGALSQPSGKAVIGWTILSDPSEPQFLLKWTEELANPCLFEGHPAQIAHLPAALRLKDTLDADTRWVKGPHHVAWHFVSVLGLTVFRKAKRFR